MTVASVRIMKVSSIVSSSDTLAAINVKFSFPWNFVWSFQLLTAANLAIKEHFILIPDMWCYVTVLF